jgi:acyl dehydratase
MDERIPRPFTAVEIGDEIGPVTRVPTTEFVRRYATVARIIDRRFLDPDIAHQKGFVKPIVPGPLSATFLVQMLTDHFPGWRLRTFNVSFRTPVGHGDTLNCWGMVTEKSGQEEDGTATVHCDVVAENHQGERVIVGTASLCRRDRHP